MAREAARDDRRSTLQAPLSLGAPGEKCGPRYGSSSSVGARRSSSCEVAALVQEVLPEEEREQAMIGALPPEGRGAPATGNCGGQTAIWTCLKD
jgi:hypothetical protein